MCIEKENQRRFNSIALVLLILCLLLIPYNLSAQDLPEITDSDVPSPVSFQSKSDQNSLPKKPDSNCEYFENIKSIACDKLDGFNENDWEHKNKEEFISNVLKVYYEISKKYKNEKVKIYIQGTADNRPIIDSKKKSWKEIIGPCNPKKRIDYINNFDLAFLRGCSTAKLILEIISPSEPLRFDEDSSSVVNLMDPIDFKGESNRSGSEYMSTLVYFSLMEKDG